MKRLPKKKPQLFRVVLVEDDSLQAGQLSSLLTENIPGVEVRTVSTESDFRRHFDEFVNAPPVLFIIDLMLRWANPTVDIPAPPDDVLETGFIRGGVRCLAMLQSHPRTRTVPVMVWSTFLNDDLRQSLSPSHGTVVVVEKSAPRDTVLTKLRGLLSTSAPIPTAPPTRDSEQDPGFKVFISYSHRDRRWLDEIKLTLRPYVREGDFAAWDDTMIRPGAVWRKQIERSIQEADVALLLVSRHFFASDFIAANELPPLLQSAQKRGTRIFWIAVSASQYKRTTLEPYQAANDPSKPLDSLPPAKRSRELVRIAEMLVGDR